MKTTLHLMVGLPCSGKTTLAHQLERELPALRLTPDEWYLRLFGWDLDNMPLHDERHGLIEAIMWDIGARALTLGVNVILDFGFWAREEREDFRSRAARLGAASEVHFLDVPPEELLDRNRKRATDPDQGVFNIPEEYILKWIDFFQAPGAEELRRRDCSRIPYDGSLISGHFSSLIPPPLIIISPTLRSESCPLSSAWKRSANMLARK